MQESQQTFCTNGVFWPLGSLIHLGFRQPNIFHFELSHAVSPVRLWLLPGPHMASASVCLCSADRLKLTIFGSGQAM